MASRKTYPGSIDRRPSGSWRWRGSIDGERVQKTWKPDEVDAASRPHESHQQTVERLARDHYDELAGEMHREESGSMPLSRFITRFEREEVPQLADSSQRSYNATLDALRAYFDSIGRDPRLQDVSKGHVKRFLNWRRKHSSDGSRRDEPMSDYTVRTEYAIVRRLFGHAHELELIPGNPADQMDPPTIEEREPVLISEEQLEDLLEECEGDNMLRMYVLLLAEAGLRSGSEAPWLKWEDLDLEDGFLQVVSGRGDRQTKNRKGRWVPLTSRLREALREHAAKYRMQTYDGQRSPWVLHHLVNNRWADPGDRRKDFKTALNTAIENAGLPEEFRPHDLRHRRCTQWLSEGHSPAKVRKAMGHSSLEVTLQYEHLVRRDLRGMVEEEEREELAEMKG